MNPVHTTYPILPQEGLLLVVDKLIYKNHPLMTFNFLLSEKHLVVYVIIKWPS